MKKFMLFILVTAFITLDSNVIKIPTSLRIVQFEVPKFQIKTTEIQIKTPVLLTQKQVVNKKKDVNKEIIKLAKSYLGVKYRWGGNSMNGIDCSGFVKNVYSKEIKLPRTSGQQFKLGKKITKKNSKKGDLIFFSDSKRHIGHVGIIIDPEKNLMIHASMGAKKVLITNYNKPYYRSHYKGIRRVT